MMTEAKHTPGPWVWRGKDGSLRQKGEPPYAYGQSVLRPEYEYDSGLDTVVSAADALLIAAAPDMLEALKRIAAAKSDGLDHERDVIVLERAIAIAQRAIAKATGAA